MDPNENVIQAGPLTMRTKFEDYTGLYVQHCHRLNHEDNGLMTLINVIPAVSTYAVAVPGSPGRPAEVKVYDGNGDRLVATVTPFRGFEGSLSVAMGDVDGDNVLDLIVGAGKGHAPRLSPIPGKANGGKAAVRDRARAFAAFAPDMRGRCQRDSDADRRIEHGQHHRGIGTRHSGRGQGVSLGVAGIVGHGAEALLDIQPVRR